MSRNNPVKTNLPASGMVGALPPPGAPHEIAQPLRADAGRIIITDPVTQQPTGEVVDPMQRARENERQLDPNPKFNVGGVDHTAAGSPHSTGGVAEAVTAAAAGRLDPFYARMEAESARASDPSAAGEGAPPRVVDQSQVQPQRLPATSGSRILRRRPAVPGSVAPPSATTTAQVPVAAAVGGGDQATTAAPPSEAITRPPTAATGFHPPDDAGEPPLTSDEIDAAAAAAELAVLQLTHPAASNTDSPSRGMPRRDPRAGLNVTGGWGDANAGAQYFALSGDDLRTIAQQMLLEIHDRIANDLRFSIALVYPRVSVRASLHIHGFAGGPQSFEIERIRPADVAGPGGSPAPEAIAQALADEVVFTLIAERREVDDAGDSVAAPDQLRDEFGMERPGKRVVGGTGTNKRMADI